VSGAENASWLWRRVHSQSRENQVYLYPVDDPASTLQNEVADDGNNCNNGTTKKKKQRRKRRAKNRNNVVVEVKGEKKQRLVCKWNIFVDYAGYLQFILGSWCIHRCFLPFNFLRLRLGFFLAVSQALCKFFGGKIWIRSRLWSFLNAAIISTKAAGWL